MLISVNKHFLPVLMGSCSYLFQSFGGRAISSGFPVPILEVPFRLLDTRTISSGFFIPVLDVSFRLLDTRTVSSDFLEFMLKPDRVYGDIGSS